MPLNKAYAVADNDGADTGGLDTGGLEDIIITAPRLMVRENTATTILLTPQNTAGKNIDGFITDVAGLQLFRRADSFTAHPTTQGLNMRGVGANAAGRVLVTLDGVPVAGPFGGWVFWSGLTDFPIADIAITKGGSAGAYGAQSLTGRVDIRTQIPTETGGSLDVGLGTQGRLFANGHGAIISGNTITQFAAGHFENDGAYLIGADQRGPADIRASLNSDHGSVRTLIDMDGTQAMASLRWFHEDRINGLEGAVSDATGLDAVMRLVNTSGAVDFTDGFEITATYQNRDFNGGFISVRDAERTVTRPVLDQYDVPGESFGMMGRVQFGVLELGVDGRWMQGEVNENFSNIGTGFRRVRFAGGKQSVIGAFADYQGTFGDTTVDVMARLDRYKSFDGFRTENNLADGVLLRDEPILDQSDWVPTTRITLDHNVTDAIDFVSSVYRTWRMPTINEYYRPFRVGNDITEANANLDIERLLGFDMGLIYQPISSVKLQATYYRNWLSDGVGNITVAYGPGFFPLGGFVPEGGVLRQRANIDKSITDGVELSAYIGGEKGVTLDARYAYARARITDFEANPDLEGLRPAQTPRHSIDATMAYKHRQFYIDIHVAYRSNIYGDDANARRLGDMLTVDATASAPLQEGFKLVLKGENITNSRVVSAISGTGLVTLAQTRALWATISVDF